MTSATVRYLAVTLAVTGCSSRAAPVVQPAPIVPPAPVAANPAPVAPRPEAPPMAARVGNAPMAANTVDSTMLGSATHPVLANGPTGQREYLRRLQCKDMKAPAYVRNGSTGSRSGFGDGHILDAYTVTCRGDSSQIRIYMDMYHAGREMQPISGFTILPEIPEKMATGCPPKISENADSNATRIFNWQEIATSARPVTAFPDTLRGFGVTGTQQIDFVVDTLGVPDMSTVRAGTMNAPDRFAVASKLVAETRFVSAEHHAGCKVKQRLGMTLHFK